jgi:YHS domain-containing protein
VGEPLVLSGSEGWSPERARRDVRFLARILQFILFVVIIGWLGRLLFGWLLRRNRPAGARPAPAEPQKRPLHRDPVCGTWVSAEISHTLEQAGQTHHFCSPECRDRYLAGARLRASG